MHVSKRFGGSLRGRHTNSDDQDLAELVSTFFRPSLVGGCYPKAGQLVPRNAFLFRLRIFLPVRSTHGGVLNIFFRKNSPGPGKDDANFGVLTHIEQPYPKRKKICSCRAVMAAASAHER